MGELIEFPTGRIITGSAEPTAADEMQADLVTLMARAASACLEALRVASPEVPNPHHPSNLPPAT